MPAAVVELVAIGTRNISVRTPGVSLDSEAVVAPVEVFLDTEQLAQLVDTRHIPHRR